ncbi:hypothetical protein DPEC_G00009830 [Dallia pectoralis]|uniref:Uncharacterized protein n=1 Tax=Dallia pectoralis TaxID=75939 RepID=A0ACC2HLW2_DALPE|nr:hypothetical protein DPEC_G00009830 [Dallia pectoralis]
MGEKVEGEPGSSTHDPVTAAALRPARVVPDSHWSACERDGGDCVQYRMDRSGPSLICRSQMGFCSQTVTAKGSLSSSPRVRNKGAWELKDVTSLSLRFPLSLMETGKRRCPDLTTGRLAKID